ncbi:MAG: RHS repeat-associated core domain-containing protein [Candidatus Melainabacteria bacterium]|nr:RHS repeat-associated core domain-containing protein [Candidatus Melainabacteria bacterium]
MEITNGSLASTKQFVGGAEERDSSGTLVSQFFALGQRTSGSNYFYRKSGGIDNVVGVSDNSGNEITTMNYGPYGNRTQTTGTFIPDFGYAFYYLHQRSGLNLTRYRAYNPHLGRWLSYDPADGSAANLYAYANNNPVCFADSSGLFAHRVVSGNNVTITIPINFTGPGYSKDLGESWKSEIEAKWTGNFGKWNVKTTVVLGVKGVYTNNINVPCGQGKSGVIQQYGGAWLMQTGKGTWYAGSNIVHEAGHLLGLPDMYKGGGPAGSQPWTDKWGQDAYSIMGTGTQVTPLLIDLIVNPRSFDPSWF